MKKALIPALILVLWLVAAAPCPGQSSPGPDNPALIKLQAMSEFMGRCKTLSLSFDSAIEIITPQLEKIQFTNSGEAVLQRPDKLWAHRKGGFADVALFFNGTSVSIHGRHLNGHAQFEAPGDTDQLIHMLRDGHGVALPGADLLLTNAYDLLSRDVEEAKYLGPGIIQGNVCDHLAFRNFDTDWQIWIETGDTPIPRKLVITSKTLNSAPQYSLTITRFEANTSPGADRFEFTPPKGSKVLNHNELIDLDELPRDHSGQGSEYGGTP